ncbi:hypothetical protein HK098_004123 [Nowakowskiella sp. JEL0407]|nr:hypothetical protein HK098_004123 [Nowakowskiella sp. JEL0407]
MGLQSTGKSYTLNHLTGTHFEGSAKRCTEGIWMALSIWGNVLYVVMDFEGLGSGERNDEEDMYLSVFNAAVSNLILFKTNFSLGRNLSTMFKMFQNGSNLITRTHAMFNSYLVIHINDVPDEKSEEQVVSEYEEKLQEIIETDGEKNFLRKLFGTSSDGEMLFNIEPWPMFNTPQYHERLAVLLNVLHDESNPPVYRNSINWRMDLKHLLIQFATKDWISISLKQLKIRMDNLNNLKAIAIEFGTQDPEQKQYLYLYDEDAAVADETVQWEISKLQDARFPVDLTCVSATDVQLRPDSSLRFSEKKDECLETRAKVLFDQFTEIIPRTKASSDRGWGLMLKNWILCHVERRIARLEIFVEKNLEKLSQSDQRVVSFRHDFRRDCDSLLQSFTLCLEKCSVCGLVCIDSLRHDGSHSCGTDHKCRHMCDFPHANPEETPTCRLLAEHAPVDPNQFTHICEDNHTCSATCKYASYRGCQIKCTLSIKHDESIPHSCSAKHFCDKLCAIQNVKNGGKTYNCPDPCSLELNHDTSLPHKCTETKCPLACEMCKQKCASEDHLHALHENPTHLCSNSHQCTKLCDRKDCKIDPQDPEPEEGICEIEVEPPRLRYFENEHGKKSYELASYR